MDVNLEAFIRDVPDFPKPGIVFKDITPLLSDPEALRTAVHALSAPYRRDPPDLIAAAEARGFIFAGAVAHELDCGFVPLRKPGKLPTDTIAEKYELEYGTAEIEMHRDAIQTGDRVLVLDDLLAIGGTAAAAIRLVERLGGQVIGAAFLIELNFLNGRERLGEHPVHSVLHVS